MKIHLDLDAFFVSAHRINDSTLLHKPVVVGKRNDKEIFMQEKHKILSLNQGAFTGDTVLSIPNPHESYYQEEDRIRGLVVTASYEAREKGIHVGMSIREAYELCPTLITLKPDYALYHHLSFQLKQYLIERIPDVEQFSIDEFFGDITGWIKEENTLSFIRDLKASIFEMFHLPVSIGAAPSKWTAKLATSYAKPFGVKVVTDIDTFIDPIAIHKFPGIGKKTEKKLKAKGIFTLGDVKRHKEYLYSWKKPGITLYHRVTGRDEEEVKERISRKSVGISRRFDPVFDRNEILRRITVLCRYLSYLIMKKELNPEFYYLKINYFNQKKSKSHITEPHLFNEKTLTEIMYRLFVRADIYNEKIVALSLHLARFNTQYGLFSFHTDQRKRKLSELTFNLRKNFGVDIIKNGNELSLKRNHKR